MNSYENNILEAVEIITNQKIDEADFNRTVQATIIKIVDAATAQYMVKYQDSRFTAVAINKNKLYQEGQNVYVLIPSNDTKQDKMIIGAVEKNADFVTTIVDSEKYEIVGTNCVNSMDNTFELCSYTPNGDIKILYDRENRINLINLNTRDVQEYIQQSSILCGGADFKTQLPAEQQLKGNYGIVFELAFEDGLMKNYMVDVNQMTGNPYKLIQSTTQRKYFEIGEGFQYINKIYIFKKDFPYEDDEKENDIFVKNIFIGGAIGLTSDELLATRIILETPDGSYFSQTEDINEKRIIAKVKISGKAQDDISNIKFYWFKENSSIDLTSPKYNHAGGAGWEYLTEGADIYTVHKIDIVSEEQMYKCVADVGGILYSQVIVFKNYDTEITISIQSSNGTVFYYDMGEITLTCNVEGGDPSNEYTYHWTYEDSNEGTAFLDNNTNIQNVYIKDISLSRKYICSIYLGDVYIGTTSVTLYNQTNTQDIQFQLKILNSNVLYQYDIDGNKPNVEIKPLKCILCDEDGNEIDEDIFSKCEIIWTCPQDKTMLKSFNADLNNLTYAIEDRYDIEKVNNKIGVQVKLDVQYIYKEFSIDFIKNGETGTNGTRYAGKIVLNAANDFQYPVYSGTSTVRFWNTELYSNSKWFKIQLWKDNKKIYEGYNNGVSTENKQVQLKWTVLKNKYTNEVSDYSKVTIDENGNYTAIGYIPENRVASSVIQCEINYEGTKIYCTKPLLEGESWSGNKVFLVEGTGYTSVQYNSQGRNPKYQNDIFEIQVLNQNGLDITQRGLTYNWSTYGQVWDSTGWHDISIVDIVNDDTLPEWKKRIQPKSEWNGECTNSGIKVEIYQNSTYIATLNIPLFGYLDRSMNQNIEGWNGNSIQLKENNGGYLYTPQVGAGKKESDQSFTGMILGKAKENGIQKTGLLGYSHGEQSLFLDAESGGAIFGKGSQGGQVIIDPESNKSMLYSHSYWRNYNEKGFPVNYENSNKNEQGMIIDLTTPEIAFGNGKSKITSDGFLIYEGGLTSKGIFTQLKYRVGWDFPGSSFNERESGFSYGILGFMPHVDSYTNYGGTYNMYPTSVSAWRYVLYTPIFLPDDFEIEKVIVKCQYRKYKEQMFSTETVNGNGILPDDYNFSTAFMELYPNPSYVTIEQITYDAGTPSEYTQTGATTRGSLSSVNIYIGEKMTRKREYYDTEHMTPYESYYSGILMMPNYELRCDTTIDNNLTLLETISTSNAEENTTHFINLDMTNDFTQLDTGKYYYLVFSPNQTIATQTINDYYKYDTYSPYSGYSYDRYKSRSKNLKEIALYPVSQSLFFYADVVIEGYMKTNAFQ